MLIATMKRRNFPIAPAFRDPTVAGTIGSAEASGELRRFVRATDKDKGPP
jgi:hypothetical protein